MYRIKDMPINERPRERLKIVGVENLSDEELLAIVIKIGTKKHSAKVLASKILANLNGLENLKKVNFIQLIKIDGIGETKATTILAMIEIAKRISQPVRFISGLKLTNPQIVFNYFKNKIGDSKQEQFFCLYLDSQKKVIKEKLLFKGTINKSLVHPREIFKEAFLVSACSIICVHNHPSGNLEPSPCDLEFTKELKKMADIFGIGFDDHIIVSKHSFYSFLLNSQI